MKKNIDYVECPICGKQYKRLNAHIRKHNISFSDFKAKYPNCETTCQAIRDKIKNTTKESVNSDSCKSKRRA